MDFAATSKRSSVLPLLADIALALALTVAIQVERSGLGDYPGGAFPTLLITIPLIWRRSRPLPVFVLVVIGVIITFTSDIDAFPPLVDTSIAALVIAAYSVGVYSRNRAVAVAVIVGTASLIAIAFGSDPLPPPPTAAVPFMLLLGPFLVGQALRTRQLRAEAFRERAIRVEQEQEFATQIARGEERARIARELHDVVAHSVSVMVVQAGAARHIVDRTPEQAVEALAAVESTGREAMAELRTLLGVLMPEDGQDSEAPLAPRPGVAQLSALVQRVRDAGLPAEFQMTGTPRMLAPGLDLTVYRIVQEALTNTLKHAGPVPTEILLDYRDDGLKVEVLDEGAALSPSPTGSPGRGLAGMRDRVGLFGGTVEAVPRLGGGFAVRAWLPFEVEDR